MLPFPYVSELLSLLNSFIELHWEVELSCRCILFLLRIHQGQITANQLLLPTLDKLRGNADMAVTRLRVGSTASLLYCPLPTGVGGVWVGVGWVGGEKLAKNKNSVFRKVIKPIVNFIHYYTHSL